MVILCLIIAGPCTLSSTAAVLFYIPNSNGISNLFTSMLYGTIARYHRLGRLNNINVFSHSSRGYESVNIWSIVTFCESSHPGLYMAIFSLCGYMVFLLRIPGEGVELCAFSQKDTDPSISRPHPYNLI